MRIRRIGKIPTAHVGMRGYQHVAGQGADDGEAASKVVDDVRVARVVDERVAGCGKAVDVSDAENLAITGVVPGPRDASRRVSGDEMRGEAQGAERNDFAIVQQAIGLYGRVQDVVAEMDV